MNVQDAVIVVAITVYVWSGKMVKKLPKYKQEGLLRRELISKA